jgi:hypothetical protein
MKLGGLRKKEPTLEASGISNCGTIKDGIVFEFRGLPEVSGCFIVDFDDLEKAYRAAKAERADVIATRQERKRR